MNPFLISSGVVIIPLNLLSFLSLPPILSLEVSFKIIRLLLLSASLFLRYIHYVLSLSVVLWAYLFAILILLVYLICTTSLPLDFPI